MSSTIEVSLDAAKVLADNFQHALAKGKQPTFSAGDLRFFIEQLTLLAAPVVERQPMLEHLAQARDKSDWTPEDLRFYATGKHYGTENGHRLAKPELAELQATIARLTAENEENRNEREIVCANYEQLKAENERLKGGQGEPVASEAELIAAGFGYPMSKEDAVKAYKASLQPRTDHPSNEDCEWCHGCGHDPYGDPCVGCCKPASQPAPVSVDLSAAELRFIDAIAMNPGAKLNSGIAWDDEGNSLWARLEALGLIECIGGYKWKPTFNAVELGVKAFLGQQPAPDVLKAFANEMIDAAFEGGSFDGGDIQDIAVKHGLLRIESRDEACGEACNCTAYGFPAECYRKTPILAGGKA